MDNIGHSDNYIDDRFFNGYGQRDFTQVIPEQNRWRFYRIEVGQGLFSPYLVRAWGRIGSRVRVIEEFYPSVEAAVKEANSLYRKRIRKGYKEVESIFAPEFRMSNNNAEGAMVRASE